ncbi:hypothetical protein BC826DRAFT_969327 [Russula brevipes]|nr:hypothetical protein BC826DRAFT_969327 [Russula brevipes]
MSCLKAELYLGLWHSPGTVCSDAPAPVAWYTHADIAGPYVHPPVAANAMEPEEEQPVADGLASADYEGELPTLAPIAEGDRGKDFDRALSGGPPPLLGATQDHVKYGGDGAVHGQRQPPPITAIRKWNSGGGSAHLLWSGSQQLLMRHSSMPTSTSTDDANGFPIMVAEAAAWRRDITEARRHGVMIKVENEEFPVHQ